MNFKKVFRDQSVVKTLKNRNKEDEYIEWVMKWFEYFDEGKQDWDTTDSF